MTMTLIETVTVGSGGAANITFSSIPQTATDLLVVVSARTDQATNGDVVEIFLNGSTSSQTMRQLYGTGSSTFSSSGTTIYGRAAGASDTSNTFGNAQFYIPNYAGSSNKSVSVDSVAENNGTVAQQLLGAGLWSNTAAVTSIVLKQTYANLVQYSTASLYTITKGSGGASVS